MQDGIFNRGNRTQRTGNISQASTFIIHVCTANNHAIYRQEMKALPPTISKGVFTAQLLILVLLTGTRRHSMHTKAKKWKDLPLVAGEPSPALSSSGRAGPPHSRHCCAFRPRLPPTGRSQDHERRNQARKGEEIVHHRGDRAGETHGPRRETFRTRA